eukprot:CAMPEP_0172483558 /NCGR_PEP_ID=MMETSP1066-20121228/10548_1 /TAXON_ID=671091 /ORGANISM="Coscinodiscus wailesii, Strain CCMP2513" /LENGTH=81 /DNA_ID=CAMNT_0013247473 /DNA_START=433 /DNA_END=678 /DNA_ORIENTATION=+
MASPLPSSTTITNNYDAVTPHGAIAHRFRAAAMVTALASWTETVAGEWSLWLSSTLKKRKVKMNKHKLRKRRKKNRMKVKK